MVEKRCFILYHDCDGEDYEYELTPSKIDMILHALNVMRSDYCIHSIEFKVISDLFDYLMFVYEDGNEEHHEIQ